jgi:GPI mannosyltransferase 3
VPTAGVRLSERSVAAAVLTLSLLAGGLLQLRLALHDESIYWPDEIHKSLEPAHRLAFGYGFRSWEFIKGASSWFLPGLLAGVMRVLDVVGFDEPHRSVALIRALFVLGTLAAAVATARLARVEGAGPLSAAVAGSVFVVSLPILFFSHRALSEVASLAPVTFGVALILDRGASARRHGLGALLLVLAVFLRLQTALFCIGALAALAARRDWRALRVVAATLGAGAVAFGLFDFATWGRPFQSAIEYGRFNLVQRGAEGWGTASAGYYAEFLHRQLGAAFVLLAVLAVVALRRSPALFGITFLYVAVHSLEPHKEARFLLPALPLFFALGAVGCSVVIDGLRRLPVRALAFAPAAALLVVGAWPAPRVDRLTYADVGQGAIFPPANDATDNGTAFNHLLYAAHDRPDLCGLFIRNEMRVWTGGYAYLHRRVPVYGKDNPPADPAVYNYAIDVAQPGQAGVVAAFRGKVLLRLRPPPCGADPRFTDRL